MSNTPVTMNERRARTYLGCVRAVRKLHDEFPTLFDENTDDLAGAELMMQHALRRIQENERRISSGRGHSVKVR